MPKLDLGEYLRIQSSRLPDNRYFDEAIVSWNIIGNGLHGTTGLIQPGFSGEFDIPKGGEQVRLVEPEVEEQIIFDVFGSAGNIVRSMTLRKTGEVFVPEGRDRLSTPAGQLAVRYLCLYPGKPASSLL